VSLAYRYAIATVISFAWCFLARRSLRFGLREHGFFLLLGLLLFGFNYLSAYQAQIYITSALNAIGFSTMIWLNILNARLFIGTHIAPRTYLGATMGMAGILIIFVPEVEVLSFSDRIVIGGFFSILGALIASLGNIASQAAQRSGIPVLQANAWGMFYGTLVNGCMALVRGREFNFDASPDYVVSLVFLAIFGSVVAFACYLTLLGRVGLDKAGYTAVMVPVVALLLSALFEGMQLDLHVLAGMMLAVAGNVFILARARAR
jgi:drug/metabolite transporter (DMT)-like permease